MGGQKCQGLLKADVQVFTINCNVLLVVVMAQELSISHVHVPKTRHALVLQSISIATWYLSTCLWRPQR